MRELRFIQALLLLALGHAKTPIHPHHDKVRRRTNPVKGRSYEILKHAAHKTWQGPKDVGSSNLRGYQQQKPPRALKNGGKGGKKASGKSGKKQSQGKGGYYGGNQPHHTDPPHPTNPPSDDAIGGSACFVPLEEDLALFQFPAIQTSASSRAVVIDYSIPNEQDFGTVYVYNDPLANQALETLEDSFVSGHCVRTQMRDNQGDDFIVGGGYCHFTYTLFDGVQPVTFAAEGEVLDFFGGKLAVSGGTGYFTGVAGFISLSPVIVTQDGTFITVDDDFFSGPEDSDAFGYLADAKLVLNTCIPDLEQL